MGKAKILYYYPSLQFHTGSPKALIGFIDALDRDCFEPMFLTSKEGPLIKELIGKNVKIIHKEVVGVSYIHPISSASKVRGMARFLNQIQPDIIHIMGFEWNTDLIFAAWLRGIPIILHVHTPEKAHFQNLSRFAATKVLFCSGAERNNFQNLNRIASKTDILYNTIDVKRFVNAQADRQKFGLEPHQIAIGTVAQICKRKGIDILLEVARLLPNDNIVFLIVGSAGVSEEAFATQLRVTVEEDPILKNRVRFLGARQDIPDFLKSIDVFMLPTRAEPFGIVIIEAMAAGIPVIVTKVGGTPEIVTSKKIGRLVSTCTPEAFAQTLSEVLIEPDKGRAMALRAQESVLQRFDSSVIGARLSTLYNEILSNKQTPVTQAYS